MTQLFFLFLLNQTEINITTLIRNSLFRKFIKLEKGCGSIFVLGCAWVEIWILKSVKKMGGVILEMGKMLIFMISCFVWVLGWRKKWCSF